MQRLVETHHFGPHRVDVVELLDDDGVAGYAVLVDQETVSDALLTSRPDLEEVVRMYASRQARRGID